MSDFDKEAEREKLRKKYERDEEEREATRRMSDLLLKGARMTNRHCDACGDPLFQQNGTTFCPTCHGSPDAVEGPELEADAGGGATEAGADAGAAETNAADAGAAETDAANPSTASSNADETGDDRGGAPRADETSTADPSVAAHTSGPRRGLPSDDRERSSVSASGDLEGVRESLVGTLERFVREAETSDDPRYARECLEAAREAAETLSVLSRR